MPLYVYQCTSCDHVFEELVSAAEAATVIACPECGEDETERQPTTFAVPSPSTKTDDVPFCGRCGESTPPCGA